VACGRPPGVRSAVSAAAPPAPTAVVAAADEETRVLLRSLLRLHHVKVEGEAPAVAPALDLVRRVRPSVVVADADLGGDAWTDLLAGARAAAPSSRFVLVAPTERHLTPVPGTSQPDAWLVRPFQIRAFAEALGQSIDPGVAGSS
jgi:DNA-binding NarL/FixJ family response regulator